MSDWTFTNDPDDPCPLCVNWEEGDDPMVDEGRPFWPDGSTVPNVYRFVHDDCQADAIAYTSEASA